MNKINTLNKRMSKDKLILQFHYIKNVNEKMKKQLSKM